MAARMLYLVAGARPNFMKLAPMVRALDRRSDALAYRIVHTGQHYDREMSDVFFEELGIPKPDHHLGAGGGTHAQQTAKVMVAFEELCESERPAAVVVVGDVNSTLACSIVAKKLGIPVAHVEAGLRSGDMAMPEEINRLVTDAISDWFFVTEPSGEANLLREGKKPDTVHYVGHVMVDNVLFQREALLRSPPSEGASMAFKRSHARYGVVTLHRPSNVDDRATLARIVEALCAVSRKLKLVFVVHPTTRSSSPGSRPRCAKCLQRCRWSFRCTRELAATSRSSASISARMWRCCRRWPTWSFSTSGKTPRWCSPTAAGSRKRRPRSVFLASPCARTPSVRSR
jgi:UDP-N-acetylglucosamine 2-epimerase (non-hydrolysing)